MPKAKRDYVAVHRSTPLAAAKLKKLHPGFKSVASNIAKESNPHTGRPYGIAVAKKILAARTRGFSSADKRANPRLKRVKV